MLRFMCCCCLVAGVAVGQTLEPDIHRTNNRSPIYYVGPDDVGFTMNYSGFSVTNAATGEGERSYHRGIAPRALEMIDGAEKVILFSVFLFDSLYAEGAPEVDLVTPIVERILARKKAHPEMTVVLILDPSHKAYGDRESPAERALRDAGVDVFYSDLVSGLKKASFIGVREGSGHLNRLVDSVTFGTWSRVGAVIPSLVPIPFAPDLDGESFNFKMAYNALLLKANHRKLLVTDVNGSDELEAMASSANPHNPSAFHVNASVTAITVTFDTKMAAGMSWTGGGDSFPGIPAGKRATWSADGKTCTLPVELKPGHQYRLGFNSLSHNNFQSDFGIPLKPVRYAFGTEK